MHYRNHFPRLVLRSQIELQTLPDRISVRPIAAGHRFIDDGDPGSVDGTRWIIEKEQSSGSVKASRERVVLLRWLNRIPKQFDAYFRELWRASFGKPKPSAEDAERLEPSVRELLRFYTRIVELLPRAFEATKPSDRAKSFFSETFPAFQREAAALFRASRTLTSGLDAPCTDGSRIAVTFSALYSAVEVPGHLEILRMAAEEICIQFPVEEVEESCREPLS